MAVDGEKAALLIPRIRHVVENFKFRAYGDYSPWPGPNSNTFVQAALNAVPELKAVLPPTAIGKDFPYDGDWFGMTRLAPAFSFRSAAISVSRSAGSKASRSISSEQCWDSTSAGPR